MDKNERKMMKELEWYLAEMCEAVRTLARKHGYTTPMCLPHAEAILKKYKEARPNA